MTDPLNAADYAGKCVVCGGNIELANPSYICNVCKDRFRSKRKK